jgi:hypothetical protein
MRMETKWLRLRTPVELGSLFDDWHVCWLGGRSKHLSDTKCGPGRTRERRRVTSQALQTPVDTGTTARLKEQIFASWATCPKHR